MTMKDQLKVIKNNWLLIVVGLLVFYMLFGGVGDLFEDTVSKMVSYEPGYGYEGASFAPAPMYAEHGRGMPSGGFAPEIEERKVVVSSSLGVEVPTGSFKDKEAQLKAVLGSYDTFLLNERVDQHSKGDTFYYSGTYGIKVDARKHDALVAQLKGLGDVKSYVQNSVDVTGSYVSTKVEIDVEMARLERLNDVYKEVNDSKVKVELINTIFDQERKIKYLQDSLTRVDESVSYSTIEFSLREKEPEYAGIELVKLSELARGFVESFNGVVGFGVVAVPWLIGLLLLRWLWKGVKKYAW